MKFLFIARRLTLDTPQKTMLEVARELTKRGHQVYILVQKGVISIQVPQDIKVFNEDIDKVIRKGCKGFLKNLYNRTVMATIMPGTEFIWRTKAYCKVFRERLLNIEQNYGKMDVIMAFGEGVYTSLSAFYDPRFFIYISSSPETKENKFFASFIYRALYTNKQLICSSEGIAAILSGILLRHKIKSDGPIRVIPPIVDREIITEKAQEETKYDIKFKYLVNVADLVAESNQELLLKAFACFRRKNKDYRLIIIGKGNKLNDLLKLARMTELDNFIDIYTDVLNPYPYIANAKALVCTTSVSGFEGQIVKAQMLGTKVVACQGKGGIKELLVPNCLGALVKQKVDDIVKKLNEVLRSNDKIDSNYGYQFASDVITGHYIELCEIVAKRIAYLEYLQKVPTKTTIDVTATDSSSTTK